MNIRNTRKLKRKITYKLARVSHEAHLNQVLLIRTVMWWVSDLNFRELGESDTEWVVKQDFSRKLVDVVFQAKNYLYFQWFVIEQNISGDSLFRDSEFLTPACHRTFLKLYHHTKVPRNFSIRSLPNNIFSLFGSMI